jgi:cysteine synthase A
LYNNILETIGGTPVVKLNSIGPSRATVYVKCEFFNPLSSVKDRLALAIILDAEKRGLLKPGDTVVEATSGNTGIALAMVCAQRGYKLVVTMAESFSIERRKIMRALGAKVVLTPAPLKGTGMVKKAEELAAEHGWFLARQFENEANAAFHAQTTGPEILQDFAGKRLDYWVTGYGTGGTFSGAGKVLKAARPDIKIILSEPSNASLVSSGIAQTRKETGAPEATHPAFTPHPIQGWTPDFIPLVAEEGLSAHIHDEIIPISGPEAIETAKALARKEGIFTGISGGASTAVALKIANDPSTPEGSVILAMLADTGERYLSSPLFADILPEMNEDEEKLSQSTPSCQLP